MVSRALLLALAAAVSACQNRAVGGGAPPERRDIAPAVIDVRDGADGPARARFPLHETGDIVFEVGWQAAPGIEGTAILEIYSPDGAIYRDARAALGQPLGIAMPVAGSSISRHALTGRWWAELRLEGETSPVAAAEFEIAGDAVSDD